MLKTCFNANILPSLEYSTPVWMSSAEFHLGLLDSIVRSEQKLCEGELCCLGHRRKVGALCLLHNIYERVNHPMIECLTRFVAVRNTRASATLGELAFLTSLQN